MNLFHVVLIVAAGAVFDTGDRLEVNVLATNRLDAAIIAEKIADATLEDPQVQYTHALSVTPVNEQVPALALAA